MRPAKTASIANFISNATFGEKYESLLVGYDELPTIETSEGVNITRLGARKQLVVDTFGMLEVIIQTRRVFKAMGSVAVKATLYVCTSEGYQAVFSRHGYASITDLPENSPHSNLVGFAESNAEKRVLQALGLPDVKRGEVSTDRTRLSANINVISEYLHHERVNLPSVINSYNATSEKQIDNKVLSDLTPEDASYLAGFVGSI
mgnify:CR=1 FL=1|tara:strand:+ start:23604 stop:24215 length:612 start_codon:yes stop_codon:yes gene_type:complete